MSSVLDLVARITLDTSAYDSGLDGAKKKAGGAGTALKKGLGTAAGLVTKGIGLASAAVSGFSAKSIAAGLSFDSAMAQVAATMGKTSDEMQSEVGDVDLAWGHFSGNLRDYAQEMGANTAFSATQAAEALNFMALAGYDTEKSMSMLPNVLNLAAAGAMDLGTASDMVTDAQSALGLSMEQTTTMVDQMAKVSATTNTSVGQLGSAILTIGGTAKSMAGGTKELTQTLGILADNGIKGAEGGTHLRNMILSLQTPSKAGAIALKKLGMSYESMYDAEGKLRPLPEIFQEMAEKMEGMDEKSKDSIKNGVFNKTDLKAVNALLGTNGKRWDEVAAAIDDAAGSAEKMAATQLDNLSGDITLFKSALEGAEIAISDKLSPSLRDFVKAGSDGMSEFTSKVKDGDLEGGIKAIGNSIGKVAVTATKKIPDLIKAGGALLTGIGQGIIENVPELVSTLGDTLTAEAPKLIESGIGLIKTISSGVAAGIPLFLQNVLPMLTQLSGYLRENAGLLIDAGLDLVKNIAQGLADSLPVLIENVPTIITNIAGIINDNAPKILATGLEVIVTLLTGMINAIPTLIANIPKIIEAIVSVWSAFNWINLGKNVITFIKNGFTSLKNTLPGTLKDIGKNALKLFKGIDWKNLGMSVVNFIGGGINSLIHTIPNLIKGIGTSAVSLFKSIDWSGLGSTVLDLICGGINFATQNLLSLVGLLASDMFNAIKGVDWLELGKTVLGTLLDGLKFAATGVLSYLGDLVSDILDKFDFTIDFPHIDLPHFNIDWEEVGEWFSIPTISIDWYKKAYDTPWMFTSPTVIGNKGFGDGPGGEMVYGHNNLMDDIREAVKSSGVGTFAPVINIYTREGQSNKEIAEYVINEINRQYSREGKEYA